MFFHLCYKCLTQFFCALSLQLEADKNDDNTAIIFFKLRPDVITPDNIHSNIFVSSMLDSPVSALYHAVQKVYVPALLEDARWSKSFDPKLQTLLSELEAGLGSVMRKKDPTLQGRKADGKESSLGGKMHYTNVCRMSKNVFELQTTCFCSH